MEQPWLDAYEAGIFTEFMEQRAPGHTVLDDKIYRTGMLEFAATAEANAAALDLVSDPAAYDKREQLRAMAICARAIVAFAGRHAELARALASETQDAARRAELLTIAEVCDCVPAHAPRTFHEALQAYWFCHLGVIIELNTWDSFCPGRLDQHLLPFFEVGVADASLTDEGARELLQCFWVKFNNQPAPPKVGVTAAESGTYTDFCNINVGGLRRDGSDGVNPVTYMLLDVIDEMHLLQPSSNIQLSRKNPDRFLKRAGRVIRQGWGQPSVFNADTIIEEMLRQGKSVEDARCGGASGCVETGAFGKEAYILVGYFNLPKVLEVTLNDGVDPCTSIRLGPATGPAEGFATFDDLMVAFETQVRHFVEVKLRGSNAIERLYATRMPAPFLSLLIDDCLARGVDYHAGGARYNSSYLQGVGIGSVTDSLSAIRSHVYDRRTVSMADLMQALRADFDGSEGLADALATRTPRYGNDDDAADAIMRRVFELYYGAVNGRPNTRGGHYRINMLPTTCHIYFGSVTGASPDGRRAGRPLSEGISPVQGADRNGPTAVIRSAAKMDHVRTGGTLLNLKFAPPVLEGEQGLESLSSLVRSYFRMDGHHIQFNVVDRATLLAARANPREHRDLIVRVAGYSDYFCDLSPALQDEIIARTEHSGF
jgi:formate C-acetyltransferase